ncbi:lipoate--protein ligase family protein [Amphibacillus jilinensis]|uniref:lipoate--protein ligase family protein n=1 Tax=Amphibacillus jilinensis TaxID=1216008 RepID=UPI0002F491EC|nr:lipoate--protein ligase family protein [Amphibacillus jilinensis]
MDDWKELFNGTEVRFIDHTRIERPAWESFAIDDALAESVNREHSANVVRIWRHTDTVVLGIADTRLPHLAEATNWLINQGYQPIVRNSGGLAVVADLGVLSVSLLIKNGEKISIHQGYQKMVSFIKNIFSEWTHAIEAFEVVGSYCPGDYDLSINGKKFAGISQRRVRNGIAVQIYLSIEADHQQRAKLIQSFYQKGLQNEATRFTYPSVNPDTMESLETLLGIPLTVDDVIDKIRGTLDTLSSEIIENDLDESEKVIYQKRRKQMMERNKKALGELFE